MEDKKLIIPKDICDIFNRMQSLVETIEILAPLPFTYKKIVKLSYEVRKLRTEGWNMIYKIYPDIKEKNMTVNFLTGELEEGSTK